MPRLKRPKAGAASAARTASTGAPVLAFRPIHDYVPKIVPASQLRDWMDETRDRFAYRCLPLNMANAHGWAVLVDRPFSAVWNGGTSEDSIRIVDDEGRASAASSHFGFGVLTFHVYGLFTTPPGWNLWVTGAPNHVKRGIQPLTGLIETDWSPYTFTMNWRFTEPNHTVRFEKDEPYCFFFPVKRGGVEAFEPQINGFEDAEELKGEFDYWSKARNDFNTDIKTPESEAAKIKWQKSYFRGQRPMGEKGVEDHQTKVALKPFADVRRAKK